MNLILIGAPCSGKGTQSKILAEKYNLLHLSTGDMLRHEIKSNTELGIKIKSVINNGNFAPDEMILEMIKNKIESNINNFEGFIFDGFPRTLVQSIELDNILSIFKVLEIVVHEEEILNRLNKRSLVENRVDDNIETMKIRLKNYNELTIPILKYYSNDNKLYKIDGLGSLEEITNRLINIL